MARRGIIRQGATRAVLPEHGLSYCLAAALPAVSHPQYGAGEGLHAAEVDRRGVAQEDGQWRRRRRGHRGGQLCLRWCEPEGSAVGALVLRVVREQPRQAARVRVLLVVVAAEPEPLGRPSTPI